MPISSLQHTYCMLRLLETNHKDCIDPVLNCHNTDTVPLRWNGSFLPSAVIPILYRQKYSKGYMPHCCLHRGQVRGAHGCTPLLSIEVKTRVTCKEPPSFLSEVGALSVCLHKCHFRNTEHLEEELSLNFRSMHVLCNWIWTGLEDIQTLHWIYWLALESIVQQLHPTTRMYRALSVSHKAVCIPWGEHFQM